MTRAIRATAWTVAAAGLAAPLLRRRLKLPPPVVTAAAAGVPLAGAVLFPRSRVRDAALCLGQMYAYVVTYKMPYDDPAALERRVRIDYPVQVDRVLGLGATPTARLQHALGRPGEFRSLDKVLTWSHWLWFLVPHGAVAYHLVCHRERFPRAAAMTYAVFDVGCVLYWVVPTAPPWYAAELGRVNGRTIQLRRIMVEYGEHFWRDGWQPLYSLFGGNPLAAMPSLHFATSVMAALLLAETGPVAGAVGWSYALTLGLALVYLGEHYVVDLIAGAALTAGVRRLGPAAGPALTRISRAVGALEARARAA